MLSRLRMFTSSLFYVKESYSLYPKIKLFVLRLFFFSSIRIGFYEQISSLLKADIAIFDALSLMHSKLEKYRSILKSYWVERKVLEDMIHRVSSGYGSLSLVELLEGLVPRNDLIILSVDSRKTIQALDKVIQMIGKFNKLRLELLKMFFTPVASLLLIIILIFVANSLIFPVLVSIKPLNEFPAITSNLYTFCHFFADNLVFLLLILVITLIFVIFSLSRLTGFIRNILDRIPPYSIYKQVISTSFLISLSLLLKSGDDFNTVIHKLKLSTSNYLNSFLSKIHNRIGFGDRPGEALASIGLFDKSTQIYIEILDESYALSDGISNLTDRSIDMQIRAIKRLMSVFSSLLLFFAISFGLWFYAGISNFGLSI